MPGRNFSVGNSYRYGFNGKENDKEVKGDGNQQDYGMRIHDPRLGRFLSVDPLIKSYPQLSSYQFASNSPIAGIDLDGGEFNYYLYKQEAQYIEAQSALYLANNKTPPASLKAQQFALGLTKTLSVEGFMYEIEKSISSTFNTKATISFRDLPKSSQQQLMQEAMDKSSPFGIVAVGKGLWNTGEAAVNGDYEAMGCITGMALSIGRGLFKTRSSSQFVFRGTSEGFEGNASLQKLSITPTSTNPAKATVFAIESQNYGNGVLYIAKTKNLPTSSPNVIATLEQEVAIKLKPLEFTTKVEAVLSSQQARLILKTMGIKIPEQIYGTSINAILKTIPKMSQKQITSFVEQAYKVLNKPQ